MKKIPFTRIHIYSIGITALAVCCIGATNTWYTHKKKNKAESYYNLAKKLHNKRLLNYAIAAYQKTLEYNPTHEFAHKALGYAYLDMGDLPQAWAQFKKVASPYQKTTHEPWWANENPTGKTILIQDAGGFDGNPAVGKGFGDCIQSLRYAKQLKKYNTRIIVQARQSLIPLLTQCPYIDMLVPEGSPCPAHDLKTTTARLFQNFNTSIATIPHEIPYLYADPHRIEQWRKKLRAHHTFNIGICWSGQQYIYKQNNVIHRPQDARPIPIEKLKALAKIPNIALYALQKTNPNQPPAPIIACDETFDTHGAFTDSAALIKNLDLVITIDTAIAHLAGALGAHVWLLLPHIADWRWFTKRADSPWYPTMKLFRQPKEGDWKSVIVMVQNELETLLHQQTQNNNKI